MPEKNGLPNYKWIKFGMEYLNDVDFMQLSDGATGAYLKLYLLAGRADAGGLLCCPTRVFTEKDLAFHLRVDVVILANHLNELMGAGLITSDSDGYKITRFLDEQGPGDNEQRGKWAQRQARSRARAKGEKIPEEELEREKERDAEVEVDIECHSDITVTPPEPPPPPASSFPSEKDEEIFQNYWKTYTGRKLAKKKMAEAFDVIRECRVNGIPHWTNRLQDCLAIWNTLCTEVYKDERWSVNNPDAVMELYPIPALEERMHREHRVWTDKNKEAERKAILKSYGLLNE